MTIDGVFVTIEYGFNRAFVLFHIKKRRGQLVKAELKCEGPRCYFNVYNYQDSACIEVCTETKNFEFVEDLVKFLWKELTITKYISMDSHRASYELSRALSC